MKKSLVFFLLLNCAAIVIIVYLLLTPSTAPKFYLSNLDPKNEAWYQQRFCQKLQGKIEYLLKDKTRVDCLTNSLAIEVDFAHKWAEAIGQSLHYALMTNRQPAIGLIMLKPSDQRYFERLEPIATKLNINIMLIDRTDFIEPDKHP